MLSVDFDSSGCFFASGSSDRKVKIWDLSTRTCGIFYKHSFLTVAHTFDDHQDQVWGVAFNGGSRRLASVSDDKSMCIFGI